MSVDQSETKNVADQHPEVVKELERIWKDWNREVGTIEEKRLPF